MSTGKVIQVIGPVVDVEFPPGQLPEYLQRAESYAGREQGRGQTGRSDHAGSRARTSVKTGSAVSPCPRPMV